MTGRAVGVVDAVGVVAVAGKARTVAGMSG
jgi:hypothetical protein